MSEVYLYLTIISYILSGALLITSIILFFKLNIPAVVKDSGGALEQKQIEEIRAKNMGAAHQRGKVNVFEELEKRAKPRRGNTSSLKMGTTAGDAEQSGRVKARQVVTNSDTTILQKSPKTMTPDFIIEKDIVFVSTSEVI